MLKRLFYLFLNILPIYPTLILWFLFSFDVSLLSSFSSFTTTLGQLCALVGSALFVWNFILSAKYKFIEEIFIGLNHVYVKHHLYGIIAFILLLCHPLFLSIPYLTISLRAFTAYIVPLPITLNLPIWFGIIAMVILIVTLYITFFSKLKYEIWKKTHQFLFGVLLLSFPHFFMVTGILNGNPLLKFYLIFIYLTGIITFILRVIFSNVFIKKYSYEVTKIKKVSKKTIEIFLKAINEKINYKVGQFVFVKINSKYIKGETHPFSISSSPNSKLLSLSIKFAGDYTSTLKMLKKGDGVEITGPYGKFLSQIEKNDNLLFIAGGIGITPFLSFLRNRNNLTDPISFFYTNKNKSDAPFLNELHTLSRTNKNFKLFVNYSEINGRLSANSIKEIAPKLLNQKIFICGPNLMMKNLRSQFNKLGIRNSHIITEEFSLD